MSEPDTITNAMLKNIVKAGEYLVICRSADDEIFIKRRGKLENYDQAAHQRIDEMLLIAKKENE